MERLSDPLRPGQMRRDGQPAAPWRQPWELSAVCWLFIASGVISILSIPGYLYFANKLWIDIGVLDLWIGIQLLQRNPRGRRWGVVMLWIQLAAAAVGVLLLAASGPQLPLTILGLPTGTLFPRSAMLIYIAGTCAVAAWQLSVLDRADIRSLFGSGATQAGETAVSDPQFTPAAKDVIAMARDEAVKHNHDYVGTEHLLLALVATPGDVLDRLAIQVGIHRPAIAARVGRIIRRGTDPVPAAADLPFTSRAHRVLELALESARSSATLDVGPAHLLFGLCAEEKGVAARVLAEAGISTAIAKSALPTGRAEARAP